MINRENHTEDSLRQFANPEMISKAPEGFTACVMKKVQIEARPAIITEKHRSRNLVPLISAAITILLIAASVLVSDNNQDLWAYPVLEYFRSFRISLPKIDLTSIFSSDISTIAVYALIGIFILSLFDRALYGIFHGKKLSGSQK
jgi:hypothetical protein